MAQTTHKASFGPLVSFFFFFLIFLILTIKKGYYMSFKGSERVMGAGDDENGPISEFFFFSFLFSHYLLLQIGTTCVLKGRKGSWELAMTKTGPNDSTFLSPPESIWTPSPLDSTQNTAKCIFLGGTGVHSTPLQSTPVQSSPVDFTQNIFRGDGVHSTPLQSSQVQSSGLHSSPNIVPNIVKLYIILHHFSS